MAFQSLSPSTFDTWFAASRASLVAYAAKLIGPDEAEDAAQEVYCRARKICDVFDARDDSQAFTYWLISHLNFICLEWLRRRAQETPVSLSVLTILRDDIALQTLDAATDSLLLGELYRLLESVRPQLTIRQQTCADQWLDGVTQVEIARFLGISQPAVAGHIAAVKQKMLEARASVKVTFEWWWFEDVSRQTVYRKPSGVWKHEDRADEKLKRERARWRRANRKEQGQ